MEKQNRSRKELRRQFLSLGILAGVSAILGFKGSRKVRDIAKHKVKMMGPDGKLVEVEAHHLPPRKGKKSTVEELKKWKNPAT